MGKILFNHDSGIPVSGNSLQLKFESQAREGSEFVAKVPAV
jgi:hypothetical protein